MFEVLINKIYDIVSANEYVEEAYKYEAGKFKGTPAVTISPSGNESSISTNIENKRDYIFTLRVFIPRSGEINEETADSMMRELIDSLINDFDKDYTLTGLEVPTGYTFINIFAAPSVWGYFDGENQYRVAEIELKCKTIVDLNQIS